nr:protein NRT1/ PTR FAMILY 7.3 [Ipomoea trifida]
MAALPNDLLHGSAEKLKCILRLLPIWLYTIIYSMVFTQMASLFVEQGDAVGNKRGKLQNPSRKFLDRAFVMTSKEVEKKKQSPWQLYLISQVEKVKYKLRLLPIWPCLGALLDSAKSLLPLQRSRAHDGSAQSPKWKRLLDPLVRRINKSSKGKPESYNEANGGITHPFSTPHPPFVYTPMHHTYTCMHAWHTVDTRTPHIPCTCACTAYEHMCVLVLTHH